MKNLRESSLGSRVAFIAIVAIVAVLAWWASRATLTDPDLENTQEALGVVWAEAVEGSVGRPLPLTVTVRQPSIVIAQNSLAGVVTVVSPGQVVEGDELFRVGETSVHVVEAEFPFWRTLEIGVRGVDVVPLQRLLIEEQYLEEEPDGYFDSSVKQAVEAWQENRAVTKTGSVELGELVAVPNLPAVLGLGESLKVGRIVVGGEDAVLGPAGDREFVLVVGSDQARLIPMDATVDVTFDQYLWEAVIAESDVTDEGSTELTLKAPDGGPVCKPNCSDLPGDSEVIVRAEVAVSPQVNGITVPAAAVRTRDDASTYVISDSGKLSVEVIASGQGLAVIDGSSVKVGLKVQVSGGVQDLPAPEDKSETTEAP